ncbi:MAG: Gfo/Idh/MocA family oxidoreductase [Oscillospiraceae bacterium]|nr:Gfo/Idh/MocA family oxidoreductase [Oscillospiraceae bacterium]
MQDWKQQSILLAGLGSIGQRHLRALLALGVTDIRAFDPSEAQRERAKALYPALRLEPSYEAGLAGRPAAVYILTPPKMHIPMALQALESGCHVFSEKPLSDTLDGVDALQTKLAETGRTMAVGLCFRYHAGIRKARALLDAGAVGRLVSVRSLMGEHFPTVRPDYKTLFSAKYSGAFDLMHDLDLAMWFAGLPVRELHAVYGAYSDIGIEAPDVAEILIGFEGRCTATVHLDFFQQPRRRQVELLGTEGCILVDFSAWDTCTVRVYRAGSGAWEVETLATDRDDMFRDESRAFLTRIAGSPEAAVCGVEDALLSLRALHQIQRT